MADLVVALRACEPFRLARCHWCSGRWRTRGSVCHRRRYPSGSRVSHRMIPMWHSVLRSRCGELRREAVGRVCGRWCWCVWALRLSLRTLLLGVRWGQRLAICAEAGVGSGHVHRVRPWRGDHARRRRTVRSPICSSCWLSGLWTYPVRGDTMRVVLWARRMTRWGTSRRSSTFGQLHCWHVIGPRRSHWGRNEGCAGEWGVERVGGRWGQCRGLGSGVGGR